MILVLAALFFVNESVHATNINTAFQVPFFATERNKQKIWIRRRRRSLFINNGADDAATTKVLETATSTTTTAGLYSSSTKFNEDTDDPSSSSSMKEFDTTDSRSVQDYVLGVHGGKYQFQDSTTAGTAVGRDFANMMYSSSSSSNIAETKTLNNKKNNSQEPSFEEWPNWAQRMVQTFPTSSIATLPTLKVPLLDTAEDIIKVPITNVYRTWEPYYSTIIEMDPSDANSTNTKTSQVFNIVMGTGHGTLAPQGGAANVCDETKPYRDTATVCIRRRATVTNNNNNSLMHVLIIGTEEDKWYYKLLE